MRKTIYTFLYIISLTLAGLSIHQAYAQQTQTIQRAPSVDPLTEVEIGASPSNGYNFANSQERTPAGIRAKETTSSASFWGPIIFFIIALPVALWMFVSKKLMTIPEEKKSEYYSNVHQFTPYKTEYQRNDTDVDEDDIDYPKSA